MSRRYTKKQKQLLDFIEQFMERHGYSPSYREIQGGMGYGSVSTVANHIDNLIALGYLRKTQHEARSLEIVDKDDPLPQRRDDSQFELWLKSRIRDKLAGSSKEDKEIIKEALQILDLEDLL